jgi:ketosteroid isomerase-like protein
MTDPAESDARGAEVRATVDAYVEVRRRIEAGEATWLDLADFFTDDAVYVDPAWGRIQGIDEIRAFLVDSMRGLEDWRFPIRFTAIDGDEVVTVWDQVLPGTRPDGRPYTQTGVSLLQYAGDGRFCFEEDLLNMTHVLEDLAASGWRPQPGFVNPPANPNRDVTRPT